MNTQLTAVRGRQDHPPQPVPAVRSRPVRRVGLLDRAALRVGVALITWGRRPAGRRHRLRVATEPLDRRLLLEQLRNEYEQWGSDLTRLR
ncbi:hypothetical protein IWX78_002166 [Mycetocola sp. CAN_C7]|uniref:hypothetical protein n=1 Tax=Mycetocola sp. CAN_C7 TaxID=2787724 RepID=UPI0018CB6718